MARRPQIQQFAAPSQANLTPVSTPVETYIKPTVQDQAPSELSQFLTAITPALEVQAEQTKLDRLKKEREIANGIQRNKEAQLSRKKDELLGNLFLEYTKNPDASHAKSKQQVVAERDEYTNNYLGQLREAGVDETLITQLETEIMTGHSAFINDVWSIGKLEYEQNGQLNDLSQSIFNVNALHSVEGGIDLDVGKQKVHEYVTKFKAANPDISWDMINKALIDKAHDDSVNRPNSPLIAWLGDPTLSGNQLNNSKFADKAAAIRERRADSLKMSETEKRNLVIGNYNTQAAANYFDTDDTSLISIDKEIEVDGVSFTPSTQDISTSVDVEYGLRITQSMQKVQAIAEDPDLDKATKAARIASITQNEIEPLNRKFFDFYAATNQTPPKVAKGALDYRLFASKDVTDPDVRASLESSYKELDTFSKYSGNLETKLGDEYDNFLAVQSLVDNGIMNIADAVGFVQGTAIDPNKTMDVDGDALADALDGADWTFGLFNFTNKDEAENLGVMLPDVQRVAGILQQVNPKLSDEQAIQEAVKKVSANYQTVEMPSGKHFMIKVPTNSKQAKAAMSDIQDGMAQIMSDSELVTAIHSELGIEPRYVMSNGEVASRSQLAEERAAGNFPVSVYADQANFELTLAATDNPNQVYVVARTKDGTQSYTLTSINLNSYSKGKLQQLKDSYVTAAKGQLTDELTGKDELDGRGAVVDTVFDIDTSQPEEVFAPEITQVEEVTRLFGAGADRRTAEAGMRDFMEQQRNELLGRARIAMQNQGVEPAAAEEASQNMFDTIFEGLSSMLGIGTTESAETNSSDNIDANEVETVSIPEPVQQPSETSDRTFSDKQVDINIVQGEDIQSKAANLIQAQEGFKANPYPDGKNKSVGYGFYLPSLEPDEKALIADVNNITETEAKAVMQLKVSKITDFMTNEVQGFANLPEKAQIAVISMGFQLGRENVRDEWPKFMTALRKAASLPTNSAQQKKALKEASTNMLYNVKGGKKTKTNWHTQTPNRANKMALALQGK